MRKPVGMSARAVANACSALVWMSVSHLIAKFGPGRIVWGSDWPHVKWRKQRMMNEAEPVELLYRYVDGDHELLRSILVDNPVRLHGFET